MFSRFVAPRIRSILLVSLCTLSTGCGGEPRAAPDEDAPASSEPTLPEDPPIFARSRRLDLPTGDARLDSVVLVARGSLPDSVTAVMRFYVDGDTAHTATWSSSYELMVWDTLRGDPPSARSFLEQRFTRALESVTLEPIDTASIAMFSDLAILDSITPRPTTQVVFSYGYETTVALAFDRGVRRLVTLWACC